MKNFILAASLLVTSAHAETVQELCGLPSRDLSKALDDATTAQSVCSILQSTGDPRVQQTARDALGVLNSLAANGASLAAAAAAEEEALFSNDDSVLEPAPASPELARLGAAQEALYTRLDGSLRSMAETLTRGGPQAFRPIRGGRIPSAMTGLQQRFGTEAQRWADPVGYGRALNDVLAVTVEGRRVLECFNRSEPGVTGRAVEFTPRAESAGVYGPTRATFDIRRNAKDNYTKVVTIDPGSSPFSTLTYLAHEYQHSCNTLEGIAEVEAFAVLNARLEALQARVAPFETAGTELPPALEAEVLALQNEQQSLTQKNMLSVAVDEMRAYQMTPRIFKELATYHPEMMCDNYYLGALFGRQVISQGQYMSAIELQFEENNRYIHTLIESYIRLNNYEASVFYELDETTMDYRRDANGVEILKPIVRETLARAGFNVP